MSGFLESTRQERGYGTDWQRIRSRGLDVFQRFEMNDAFSFSNRLPQLRPCKEFNVTFVRIDDINPAAQRTRATATEAVPAGTR